MRLESSDKGDVVPTREEQFGLVDGVELITKRWYSAMDLAFEHEEVEKTNASSSFLEEWCVEIL